MSIKDLFIGYTPCREIIDSLNGQQNEIAHYGVNWIRCFPMPGEG
jgi:hypothetical protein